MLDATALTYSNSGGTYLLSGVGKSLSINYATGASSYMLYKTFTESAITSGSVYASFLVTPNNVSQSQSQAPLISLSTSTSTSTSTSGVAVWIGKGTLNTSNYRFGVTRGSSTSADIKWGTTEFSDLTATYLLVLKYDFTTASVFVNPVIASTTEPTAECIDATSTSSQKTSLLTVQFKVNGSSKEVYNLSGLRISSTWAEAVEKATPTFLNNKTSSFLN